MAEAANNGLVDLEKELTCSICTEILYQPLTLLDCLHTFCGSCLSEWFKWQAARASSSSPYTCPSCRAAVRETRPNATVTTLLELLLRASPDKIKSREEREKIAASYRPGDVVLKPVRHQSLSETDDEHVAAGLRDLSLHNNDGTTPVASGLSSTPSARRAQSSRSISLGHQSSLRSIMSASDIDDSDMQEDIMRQIVEEGLLDDIDLNSLTPAQEEEITERIAQAVRRKQRRRRRTLQSGRETRSRSRQPSPAPHQRHRSHSSVQPSPASVETQVALSQSRLALLGVDTASSQRRSRSASHEVRSTREPDRLHDASTIGPSAAASRSSTNLATPPRPSSPSAWQPAGAERIMLSPSRARPTSSRLPSRSPARTPAPLHVRTRETTRRYDDQYSSSPPQLHSSGVIVAPRISCSRCQRSEIQHEIHYNCAICHAGRYNICKSCIRTGQGCLSWLGFGYVARSRREPDASEPTHMLSARRFKDSGRTAIRAGQHNPGPVMEAGVFCDSCQTLSNTCYWHCEECNDGAWGYCMTCVEIGKHCTHPLQAVARKDSMLMSTQSGSTRMVTDQQLPVTTLIGRDASAADIIHKPTVVNSRSKVLPHLPTSASYGPLLLPCKCALCHLHIPLTAARRHCPTCNNGDFDICDSCYTSLCATGRIARPDGISGQRLCPSGHHTTTYAFVPRTTDNALQRTILDPPAGGWAPQSASPPGARWRWRDHDATEAVYLNAQTGTLDTPFGSPINTQVLALWAHWTAAADELSFPRGAVISSVLDINGDWCWGFYMGRTGLFPGGYVRPLPSPTPK